MENEYQPTQHISQQFDVELENIKSQVLKMGALVKKQLRDGLTALLDGDEKLAKKVIKRDNKVNALEVKIDEACTSIIAIRQPAATDLRFVRSLIKTITDFERIGDEAEKLAVSTRNVKEKHISEQEYQYLRSMGDMVIEMLTQTLEVIETLNVDQALEVIKQDQAVNDEYEEFLNFLVSRMKDKPKTIKSGLSISWSARALERIGDHLVNINEYLIYLVNGKDVRHIDLEDLEEILNEE